MSQIKPTGTDSSVGQSEKTAEQQKAEGTETSLAQTDTSNSTDQSDSTEGPPVEDQLASADGAGAGEGAADSPETQLADASGGDLGGGDIVATV